MSTVNKKEALLNLATAKQLEIVRHEFTNDELILMKDQVSTNLMKQNDLEEELKEIKDEYKEKINPLKKENKHLLKNIRLRFIDEEMEVFLIPDYDNKIMELYNTDGIKVGERKMMMAEFQQSLKF